MVRYARALPANLWLLQTKGKSMNSSWMLGRVSACEPACSNFVNLFSLNCLATKCWMMAVESALTSSSAVLSCLSTWPGVMKWPNWSAMSGYCARSFSILAPPHI